MSSGDDKMNAQQNDNAEQIVSITIDSDGNEEPTEYTDSNEHRNVVEREPRRIREDPLAFMFNLGRYYQGTGWRGLNTYIGSQILYPGFSERLKALVLGSKNVQQTIDRLASKQTDQLIMVRRKSSKLSDRELDALRTRHFTAFRKELKAVAKGYANKCVATVDDVRIVRAFAFTVNSILVRLYHQGIHIKESEWVELKRVALMAQQKKQSLILMPSHKSHIDYLVVSYLMIRLGLQLPHIVAGDNLDMPIVGKILKSSGAIYIRREWGDDELYKNVMEEYMITLLSEGMNIECFVEGTRSRLGKLLQPKLGIVKIILDALIDKRFSDCHIVPISIGYDKIIETSSYANELLGSPKEKESLWGVITNTRLLQLKWGRLDVRLGKPYSLKGWLDDQLKVRGPIDLTNSDQKATLLRSLGYHILADINSVSVVMPSALVGTVILTLRGRGVGRSELIRRVKWLMRVIKMKGGNVAEFHGMSVGTIVDRTVSIHKDLIGQRTGKDILEPTFYGINRFELSYYRNQVIHLFVEEAIACVALYIVIKKGGGSSAQRMTYVELSDEVAFLSSLLKLDMIYRPGGIENNVKRTIHWLEENNVIHVSHDGWVGLSDIERQCGRENYASVGLFSLVQRGPKNPSNTMWVESKLFEKRVQALGKTLYYQGDLGYLEAVNKETLNTAFLWFQQQGIMLKQRHPGPKPWSAVALSPEYMPERIGNDLVPNGPLWELVGRIGQFRREGKSRRDNATVSSRVLRLANKLANDNLMSAQEKPKL